MKGSVALKPEVIKRPGVCYALTDDGIELPVIDLTHPAFALDLSAEEIADLAVSSVKRLQRLERLPRFVHHLMARRSILLRNGMGSQHSFYGGLDTYLLKLGAENLHGVRESRIDTLIASAIGPVSIRLRHRATASLLAEVMDSALSSGYVASRPLDLLNISGGPASDSLNAIILLKARRPCRFEDRRITIHVLDPDAAGPRFGARSLRALLAPGAVLHGLDAHLDHRPYDWSNPLTLGDVAQNSARRGAVVVASSEGGLFEYADDEVIVGNLRTLAERASGGVVMVGSYVCDDPAAREVKRFSRAAIRLFQPGEFDALVTRAGWSVTQTVANNPIYRVAALKPVRERESGLLIS